MAQLTLNFFDTTRGVAIPNLEVEVQKIFDGNWQTVAELNTDIHGNIAVTEADAEGELSGYYEVTARIGNYFLDAGYALPPMKFVDVVPIRFGVAEGEGDTAIQVSITPYGYSFQAR